MSCTEIIESTRRRFRNANSAVWTKMMFDKGLLEEHFCETSSDIAIKVNFHFPYNKAMETLSCHINESV